MKFRPIPGTMLVVLTAGEVVHIDTVRAYVNSQRALLSSWAKETKRFDNCVWVGENISIADVKQAVRSTVGVK